MGALSKTGDYVILHAEFETGISLLYSACENRSAFLNPVGTKIWLTTGDEFDPSDQDFMVEERRAGPDVEAYVTTVLGDMVAHGLLRAGDRAVPRISSASAAEIPA